MAIIKENIIPQSEQNALIATKRTAQKQLIENVKKHLILKWPSEYLTSSFIDTFEPLRPHVVCKPK